MTLHDLQKIAKAKATRTETGRAYVNGLYCWVAFYPKSGNYAYFLNGKARPRREFELWFLKHGGEVS